MKSLFHLFKVGFEYIRIPICKKILSFGIYCGQHSRRTAKFNDDIE